MALSLDSSSSSRKLVVITSGKLMFHKILLKYQCNTQVKSVKSLIPSPTQKVPQRVDNITDTYRRLSDSNACTVPWTSQYSVHCDVSHHIQDCFDEGVRIYLKRFQYSNAETGASPQFDRLSLIVYRGPVDGFVRSCPRVTG